MERFFGRKRFPFVPKDAFLPTKEVLTVTPNPGICTAHGWICCPKFGQMAVNKETAGRFFRQILGTEGQNWSESWFRKVFVPNLSPQVGFSRVLLHSFGCMIHLGNTAFAKGFADRGLECNIGVCKKTFALERFVGQDPAFEDMDLAQRKQFWD